MATNTSRTGPVDTNRIGFFFGAGSSVEFGIPPMTQMTLNFANQIRTKKDREQERVIFDIIYKSLEKVYGEGKVDIEAIMSVILGLKERSRVRENFGELGLFVLERKRIDDYTIDFECRVETLENLENEYKKYIRNNTIIVGPDKIDLLRNVYEDFFGQLCRMANCSQGENSNPHKNTASKWTFFTTNYDNRGLLRQSQKISRSRSRFPL